MSAEDALEYAIKWLREERTIVLGPKMFFVLFLFVFSFCGQPDLQDVLVQRLACICQELK